MPIDRAPISNEALWDAAANADSTRQRVKKVLIEMGFFVEN
jgi:hypothetical protein